MNFGSYEDLKDALKSIPDDNTILFVDARPFLDFNLQEDGYLFYNDEEYKEGFATYVDSCYLEVGDIEDDFKDGWGIIYSDPYPFAMPMDAQIEFGYDKL